MFSVQYPLSERGQSTESARNVDFAGAASHVRASRLGLLCVDGTHPREVQAARRGARSGRDTK